MSWTNGSPRVNNGQLVSIATATAKEAVQPHLFIKTFISTDRKQLPVN